MSAIFLKLLNMSITAGWLILAVVVARFFLKKAPKWISCLLWAMVAVRLVCPFSLESEMSLLPSGETIPENIAESQAPVIYSGVSVVNSVVNPVLSESLAPRPTDSVNPLQILVPVLSAVWLVGLLAMLLFAGICYIRLKKSVAASVPVEAEFFAEDEEKPQTGGGQKPGAGAFCKKSVEAELLGEDEEKPQADDGQKMQVGAGREKFVEAEFFAEDGEDLQAGDGQKPWAGAGCKKRAGVKILACDEVKSPFILGVFRPVIYVPSALDGKALQYVIAHERAHIRRHDHWWKPFGYLLLAIYWFHPLCWLAYALLCRDIELACDEKVIRELDRDAMAEYSQTLLDCARPRRMIAACPLAFGEVGVKQRVKGVLNYKKPAFWVLLAAFVVCTVVAVAFLTNPKQPASLQWAQTVSAADVRYISRIELDGMPVVEDELYIAIKYGEGLDEVGIYQPTDIWYASAQYRKEIEQMLSSARPPASWTHGDSVVNLLHTAKGRYVKKPKAMNTWNITFYFHMKDGTEHTVSKIGDVYLVVDGDYYKAPKEWLKGLEGDFGEDVLELCTEGDVVLKTGFPLTEGGEESGKPELSLVSENEKKLILPDAVTWFDGHNGDEMLWFDSERDGTRRYREISLEEFPGVTFRCSIDCLDASYGDGFLGLYGGSTIWNVFFCDLTGDGKPELCSCVSIGSGMVDERVIVYDYANGIRYELQDRCNFDYILSLKNGKLWVEKYPYPMHSDAELEEAGFLFFQNGYPGGRLGILVMQTNSQKID